LWWGLSFGFVRVEYGACAVANVKHGHDLATVVDRIDDPVAVPLASVEKVAKAAVFRNGRPSRRVFGEAEDGIFEAVEPVAPAAGPRRGSLRKYV
jgi:hypothetical protein